MRTSTGALALIRRPLPPEFEWLTRWNEYWEALHLLGGRKLGEETPRQCCVREVAGKLGLEEGEGFRVAERPVACLEYVAYSWRARVETRYTIELYEVELLGEAVEKVSKDPSNRWVREDEIRAWCCRDGQRVSQTMQEVLERAGLVRGRDANG